MAPGLVSAEKAARGKRPTDVWFHTIVPTNGAEKTGYPTQKPEGVLRRFVAASSRPGGWCLDPFAGSGTLGAVCRQLGRRFVLIDSSPTAIEVITRRLGPARPAHERHESDRVVTPVGDAVVCQSGSPSVADGDGADRRDQPAAGRQLSHQRRRHLARRSRRRR